MTGTLPADAACCIVLQQITVLSLFCITETAKIAGTLLPLSDTYLQRKMLGYKMRAFLECYCAKREKYIIISVKGSVLACDLGLFFPTVTVALISVFSQNLNLYEKMLSS